MVCFKDNCQLFVVVVVVGVWGCFCFYSHRWLSPLCCSCCFSGIGTGMALNPMFVSVSYYFERYRGFACGMIASGAGAGMFVGKRQLAVWWAATDTKSNVTVSVVLNRSLVHGTFMQLKSQI